MQTTVLLTVALGAFAGSAHGGPIAHSVDDFVLATADGIGVDGVAVDPGSASDAAQQGHGDSSGSGVWTYGLGRSGDGQSFSGGFPLLNNWDNGTWTTLTNTPAIVRASGQAPAGSGISADPMTYRRWTSNGSNAGELLTAQVRITLTNALSDGVTMVFNTRDAGFREVLIAPDALNQEQVFSIDFVDTEDTWVLLGINPGGVNGPSGSDFFNDFVQVELTITPAPGAVALLGLAGASGMRRRR